MDLSGQTGNQKPLPLSFLCGWGRFWVRWWFRALGGRYVGGTNGGGSGAGTFLCTKAGRACELCRGGSRPHKAQCGEACPTSLAVTGNNTDLAIKAIPNLLVINHPPDSCEWKWKNLIPPLPFPPPVDQLWGFELPLGICGDHRSPLGAGLFPLDFPRSHFILERPQVGQCLADFDSCTETGERGGERRWPQRLALTVTPLGSRAGSWQACGVEEGCRHRSSLVFPHPPPHSLALPSLPPSATKCQHISLYVSFPSPTLWSQISRSCALYCQPHP